MKSRVKKLEEQRNERGRDPNGALVGTKIYIGGYLAGTTDIEVKRIVTLAGGKIMSVRIMENAFKLINFTL